VQQGGRSNSVPQFFSACLNSSFFLDARATPRTCNRAAIVWRGHKAKGDPSVGVAFAIASRLSLTVSRLPS